MANDLRNLLEAIAHDAGVFGVIEAIPDHALERAFVEFMSCSVCTGNGEIQGHGHDVTVSLSDAVGALRLRGYGDSIRRSAQGARKGRRTARKYDR